MPKLDTHSFDTMPVFGLTGEDLVWAVIHTRPRAEKKIVYFCHQEQIPVYLPLRKKLHRYGNRERVFLSPLFPGYVFCTVPVNLKSKLLQNQYVANLLDVIDPGVLIQQLNHVRNALNAGDILEVLPYLEEGNPVRVTGGPLKGLEGVVARIKGKTRVVVNLDMIEQSVAVEVDSSMLGPL